MLTEVTTPAGLLAFDIQAWLLNVIAFVQVLLGFSLIIFVHEAGHFLAAKWCNVRVDRFAVGFGPRLFGWRRGEGFRLGTTPERRPEELKELGWGETDYCVKALPIGGYVRMLGHDDVLIDEKTGEIKMTDDPRAFTNRSVGQRMLIVSAGVVFNLLLAGVLFMTIFLVGKDMPAPLIGRVTPDSPAADAGLQVGDRVLEVNGWRADSYMDIFRATAMLDTVELAVERDGERLPEPIVIETTEDTRRGIRYAGIGPVIEPVFTQAPPSAVGEDGPQAGDRIVAVDGAPVLSYADVQTAFQRARGAPLPVTVRRAQEGIEGADEELTFAQRSALQFVDADEDEVVRAMAGHLLGMTPRRMVAFVNEDTPAEEAGLRAGDVIVQWGGVAYPTYTEIVDSIQANAETPNRVVVLRSGEQETLEVTPKRRFSLFGTPRAQVGVAFGQESFLPVVADIVPDQPAADVGLPRGALLTRVNGVDVASWYDVVDALRAASGEVASVEYAYGGMQGAGEMRVPPSLFVELGLPPNADVVSIAGEDSVELDGEELRLPSARAMTALVEKHVGERVVVKYSTAAAPEDVREGEVDVREGMERLWVMKVLYPYALYSLDQTAIVEERVHAHGNPLLAMWLGAKLTLAQASHVYMSLKQLLSARISVQNVSGPVGIVSVGVQEAQTSFTDLLSFFAFLSVNLAVLNFLPIPLVDGGVMVFLIIEKIKGSPVSLKVQMASALVGLSMLVLLFLFVTFQDISRLLGGF